MCGREAARLVHHKKAVATHPELIHDMSNLMALCHGCHNALHRHRGGGGINS
jgi:predicted HNH restriction endonuclease